MRFFPFILLIILQFACASKQKIDLLVYHATIYTVDSAFSTVEAIAVKDGKIVATGKQTDLEERYDASEKLDAAGKFIYPGLIDAHAHFLGYGFSLNEINLVGTDSWEAIIAKVKSFAAENP